MTDRFRSPLETDTIMGILRPLLLTHSPTGCEDEAREWTLGWLREAKIGARVDEAGNVVAHVAGRGNRPPVALVAHLDEIGFLVKRIDPDGSLRVMRLGGSHPWKYGEGPVDLLGRNGVVPAFLSFGAAHASEESKEIWAARNSVNLKWEVCRVDPKLPREDLEARGIYVGVKGVLSRSRKIVTELNGFVGAFALDDKALVAVMLAVARSLAGSPGQRDVYFIASVGEEIGSGRAAYAVGNTPAVTGLALEIAPMLPEYGLQMTPDPVVLYKDEYNTYDESVCQSLEMAINSAGYQPQRAVLSSFGSDLSVGAKGGRLARYGCISIPCENTHGYEIVPRESLAALARTLDAWIRMEESL